MKLSFNWENQQSALDAMEQVGTDSAFHIVEYMFNVEDIKNLTKEQIEEVFVYSESDHIDNFLGMCLRNVVNHWQNENDNFDIM